MGLARVGNVSFTALLVATVISFLPAASAAEPQRRAPATQAGGDHDRAADVEATAPPDAPSTAWPAQSEQQRAANVQAMKQRVDGWNQKLNLRLSAFETRYFLFCTDLPRQEAVRWARELDVLYARMAKLFDVPKDENIWRGKGVIIVFQNEGTFLKFEGEIFRVHTRAGGRCHYERDGNVVITFFRGSDDHRFARVLVHETTHGFLFRYRSGARIPSWVNEGLAEVMEFELVPHPGLKQTDDADARARLRSPDPLRGFFENKIEFDQYPIVRTLTEFMIRQNKQGYVDFVNAVKAGEAWREALPGKYGVPLERLVEAYGASMGVRGLQPPASQRQGP